MHDELPEIEREWNQLAADFDDDMEVEFLDEDDIVEFVHDTDF